MKEADLVKLALENGATKAAVIPQDAIVLSATFFDICKANQCGNFGKCWMCPPDVGPIEELMARVRSYPKGLLYRHPDRALPPMEGAGIDVYKTTKSTDLKYINGANTVTFFGLLLYKEEA